MLASLFGGPLWLADVLRPSFDPPVAFAISFTPLGLLLFGALQLDDERTMGTKLAVGGGVLGGVLLLGLDGWLALQGMLGAHQLSGSEIFGCVVGTGAALGYELAAYRWWTLGPLSHVTARWFSRETVETWLLLVICFTFVALGLFLLDEKPGLAISCIVLFGAGGIVPVRTLYARRRSEQRARGQLAYEEIADDTEFPISKRIQFALFGALFVIGSLLTLLLHEAPVLPWAAMIFAMIAGAVGLILVATGVLGVGGLRLSNAGLTVHTKQHSMLVPWSAIHTLQVVEYHNNRGVALQLESTALVQVTPPERMAKVQRSIERNRHYTGCHVLILSARYELDADSLARAIQRHIQRS